VYGQEGIGKPRLADAISANLLSSLADRVYFVELTAVEKSGDLVPAIPDALLIPLTGNRTWRG
jgi:hypothetical protein